jgi:muramidase (phage lysozyme)
VQLLKQCGALQYVKEGNITEASKRATRIWASLPGNNYNQGGKSLAAVKSYFTKGGGTLTA